MDAILAGHLRPPDGLPLGERYGLLAEHVTDLISLHDPEGTYLYASPSAKQILGYEPGELVGRAAYELFHPDDLEEVERSHLQILEGSDVADAVYRIRRVDGSWIWFETRSKTVRDTRGRVERIIASSRDITARKRTEERLAESEARFRSAFTDAGIGMALVGLDGRWLKVNPSVCALTGYDETELLRLTFQDITHPDDLDKDLELLQATLEGAIDRYDMEKRYFHAGGRLLWVHLTVSLVRDAQDEPLYFISQIQDITARKRAMEELREALARVRRLEGLLPICAHCKSIRDEEGSWQQMEVYIDQRSEATFSHGICPSCDDRYFGDL